MKNIRIFILGELVLFMLICIGTSVSGTQPLLEQPTVRNNILRLGEVLEYNIKIRGINAGTQVFKVNRKELLYGHEVYHVESASRANKFFNAFYPFNDQSESFIHSKDFHTLRYRRKIRDGGYGGTLAIDFDPVSQVAKIVKDQKQMELRVPAGIQDELSMIYFLRTRKLEVGQNYEFPALVGTKSLNVGVSVLRIEELKTVLGTLKTIVVRIIQKDITLWLTYDADRIPVRVEASTKIGKLVSYLKEMH